MNTVDKVIKTANAEVGYLEKRSNAKLSSKTGNAGDNNYTKYGSWYQMNGVYWCAIFVSWCFAKAYGSDAAKKLLCGGYSASCETLRQQFKKAGKYYTTPEKGDLIFFSGSRHAGANHIGIVTKATNEYVYTVEGNTSNYHVVIDNGGSVAAKCYERSNDHILGYGRPNYDKKSVQVSSTKKIKATDTMKVIAVHGLRMRKTASLKGKILMVLPHGTKVSVVKKGSSWTKVSYSKKTGYCATKYLK